MNCGKMKMIYESIFGVTYQEIAGVPCKRKAVQELGWERWYRNVGLESESKSTPWRLIFKMRSWRLIFLEDRLGHEFVGGWFWLLKSNLLHKYWKERRRWRGQIWSDLISPLVEKVSNQMFLPLTTEKKHSVWKNIWPKKWFNLKKWWKSEKCKNKMTS